MNEIERFKKNRMIPKGLYGLKPHEVLGGAVNGETVGYVNIPGKGYLAIDAKGNAYTTRNETKNGGFSRNTTFVPVKLTNYDRQQIYKAVSRNDGVTSWIRDHSNNIAKYWKAKGAPAVTKPASKPVNTPVDTQQKAAAATIQTGGTSKPVTRVTPKGQAYWDNQYQDFLGKMTDDQKAWLAQRGIDYSSAEKMQSYLSNIGKNIGKFGADNKWGNDSQAAWDDLVNTTMKNNPLQTPVKDVPQPVVDAPDPFGYKTSNHYGDGSELKNMGFNNYAGLLKFAAGDDQFAKDLRQRFGQDVSKWDQAAVEGALGVGGRYRGSRSGDFGDMARSMQQWAAKQNAAYDTKYNAGLNNAGTLGTAGAGTMNNLKQVAYADK